MEFVHWLALGWTVLAAGIGWVVKAYGGLSHTLETLQIAQAQQNVKIDACWNFMMDGLRVKVSNEGRFGTMNSPFVLTDETRKLFRKYGLDKKLATHYSNATNKDKLKNNVDLEMDIQTNFRPELIDTVCREAGWEDGRCVMLAAELTKELVVVPPAPVE